MSYIRWVHYSCGTNKIVCCPKGDEILFPTATAFYYNWENPFTDEVKCGLRDEYSFGQPRRRHSTETALRRRLIKIYPKASLVEMQEHIPFERVADYPLSFKKHSSCVPKLDIVICARRRNALTPESDRGLRNYPHWQRIVDCLSARGYRIGIVGRMATSYSLDHITAANWDYSNPTDAMIAMLRHCRLYIGTDTGPTHLAALLGINMIVFRNQSDPAYNLVETCATFVAARSNGHLINISDGWNSPDSIVRAAEQHLSKPSLSAA